MTSKQCLALCKPIWIILKTINEISVDAFSNAVQTILGAKKIYLMGLRSSSPLSSFMHFYMTVLFDDVVHIHSSSANDFDKYTIAENDVMIGISFPRYSQRTINSMDYAKRSIKVIITDKDNTAMTKSADIKLSPSQAWHPL